MQNLSWEAAFIKKKEVSMALHGTLEVYLYVMINVLFSLQSSESTQGATSKKPLLQAIFFFKYIKF